jgi:hypothetical protein
MDTIFSKIDDFVTKFKHVYINLFSYHPNDNIFVALRDIIKTRWPQIIVNATKRIDPDYMTHVGVDGYAVSIVSFN